MAETKPDVMRDRLGNIEQIREVLFGHKVQEYEQQFTNFDQRLGKLEDDLGELQTETRDRLRKLQDGFSTELRTTLDSIDKKLKYLSLTTHEETSKLQQQLQTTAEKNNQELENLSKSVNDKTSLLKDQLFQSREKLEDDIQLLKEQFFAELNKGFNFLEESKVSRSTLANILFEMCIKIKGTDAFPNLQEVVENQVQAGFLLPNEDKI